VPRRGLEQATVDLLGPNVLRDDVIQKLKLARHHFKDSRATHQAEAKAHLGNVAARYRQSLTPRERSFYDACKTENRRAAFRICRHLASRASNRAGCGDGDFFLSYADLGARLLMDPKGARKLMLSLAKEGIIDIVRKGERWEQGRRPRATWWRYLLSQP
jgi:hypothetical protein